MIRTVPYLIGIIIGYALGWTSKTIQYLKLGNKEVDKQ